MAEEKKKPFNNNPFLGRNDGVSIPGTVINVKDFATGVEIEKCIKTGEGEEDFVIVTELRIDKKVNHQDYLNQFADDVGILNVLKRVIKTGDASLFNERNETQAGYMDLTNMPGDIIAASEMINKANAAYEQLPDDLKKKLSKEDLIKINNLELYNNIVAYVDNLNKVKEKEGDKNV